MHLVARSPDGQDGERDERRSTNERNQPSPQVVRVHVAQATNCSKADDSQRAEDQS